MQLITIARDFVRKNPCLKRRTNAKDQQYWVKDEGGGQCQSWPEEFIRADILEMMDEDPVRYGNVPKSRKNIKEIAWLARYVDRW